MKLIDGTADLTIGPLELISGWHTDAFGETCGTRLPASPCGFRYVGRLQVMRKLAVISAPGAFHALGAAELVGEAMGLEVHSVGNRLREHVQQRTAWGRRISGYLDAGHLVPEEVIIELVIDMLTDVAGGWSAEHHMRPTMYRGAGS